MTKHISIRMAWHDNKWNGTICHNPTNNIYCRGNYSLLSSRIQRRINLDLENQFKDSKVADVFAKTGYIPPCYWSINFSSTESFHAKDQHPFGDISVFKKKFEDVPPLTYDVKPGSLFTWPFLIGYGEGHQQRYVPLEELPKRTKTFLSQIKHKKSIAFLYCNYSNPLTGDDYKYLLVGAGIIDSTREPLDYQIKDEIIKDVRKDRVMNNFPTQSWQMQINLDTNTSFVLPYQEYLEWYNEQSEKNRLKNSFKFFIVDLFQLKIFDQNINVVFRIT